MRTVGAVENVDIEHSVVVALDDVKDRRVFEETSTGIGQMDLPSDGFVHDISAVQWACSPYLSRIVPFTGVDKICRVCRRIVFDGLSWGHGGKRPIGVPRKIRSPESSDPTGCALEEPIPSVGYFDESELEAWPLSPHCVVDINWGGYVADVPLGDNSRNV